MHIIVLSCRGKCDLVWGSEESLASADVVDRANLILCTLSTGNHSDCYQPPIGIVQAFCYCMLCY